jgi:hypothetical protein
MCKSVSYPIEFVNYVAAKGSSKSGALALLQNWCGVEESDAFWWERPEYQHLVNN